MLVTILRGGTGCGKTTWARRQDALCISADDFFLRDGVYRFDFTKINDAHGDCLRRFIKLCEVPPYDSDEGGKNVIVDNTNTRVSECAPYVAVANAFGHEARVLTFVYDPVEAWKRNKHKTPLDIAIKQHQRLMRSSERIPPWWKHEFVIAEDDD